MAEGLQTVDGSPVPLDTSNVEQDFARAMATDTSTATDLPPRPEKPAGEARPKRGRPPKSARSAPAPVAVTPELTGKRANAAQETFELLGAGFLMAGKITGQDAFKADAYTVQGYAEPLGKAVAEVAAVDPAVARYLDKAGSGKVTAYLSLGTVVIGLGAQLAANHGMVKPGTLGSHAPADVIRSYEADESEQTDDSDTSAE